MNIDAVTKELQLRCNRRKLSDGDATVWVPDEPVLLQSVLRESADTLEERNAAIDADEIGEVIPELLAFKPLITFEWIGGGEQWSDTLYVLTGHARDFVCLPSDPEIARPWVCIAGLEPAGNGLAMRLFLCEFLPTAGDEYGMQIVAGFPTAIENHMPDCVPRDAVERALDRYLERSPQMWGSIVEASGAPGESERAEVLSCWMDRFYRERVTAG